MLDPSEVREQVEGPRTPTHDSTLPVSGWVLLVALVYATLQKGAFDAGPFRVVVALVGLAAVLHARQAARHPEIRRLILTLAGLAFGSTVLSVAFTDADLRSALPTLALTAAVLATIGIVAGLRAEAVVRLVDGVVLCGLLAAATAWIGVAFHRDPWGLVAQGIWRGSSTITYSNATGALVGIALLLAAGRLITAPSRLLVLPAVALLVGLVSTGSRAALVSAAVGLLVLGHRKGWGATARALWPVVVGGAVGVAALVPSLPADEPARPLVALVGLLLGAAVSLALVAGAGARRGPAVVGLVLVGLAVVVATAGRGFDDLVDARFALGSSDRAEEWRAAADELGSSPIVGVGPGRLDLSWEKDGQSFHAEFTHNEYLELLATHGLVGAAALAFCILVVLRRPGADRSALDRDGAVAALIVLAVHSGFDFLWHVPVLAMMGGVLVALVAAPDPEPHLELPT